MSVIIKLRLSILLISIVNVAWYLLPYAWRYIYSRSELEALAWNGFESVLGDSVALLEINLILNVFAHFYLISLSRPSMVLFAVVTIAGPFITLLSGMTVQAAPEAFVGYALTLCDGFLLAFLFSISSTGFSRIENIRSNLAR